ncbi:MAG: hypothetical protein AAFV07_02500 [Bacteroidota bacterium]
MHYHYFLLLSIVFCGLESLKAQPDSLFATGTRLEVPADKLVFPTSRDEFAQGLLVIDGNPVQLTDLERSSYSNYLQYHTLDSKDQGYLYLPNIHQTNWLSPEVARLRYGVKGRNGALVVKSRSYAFQQGVKCDLSTSMGLLTPLRGRKAGLTTQQRKSILGLGAIQRHEARMQYQKEAHGLFFQGSTEQRFGPVNNARWQNWYGKLRYERKFSHKLNLAAVVQGAHQYQEGILGELFVPGALAGQIWGSPGALRDRSLALRSLEGISYIRLRWDLGGGWSSRTKVFGNLVRKQTEQSFGAELLGDSLRVFEGALDDQNLGINQIVWYVRDKGAIGALYQRQINRWRWPDQEGTTYRWTQHQAILRGRVKPVDPWLVKGNIGLLQASHLSTPQMTWNVNGKWSVTEHRWFSVFGLDHLGLRAQYERTGQDPLATLPSIAAGQGLIIPEWGWPWINSAPVPGKAADLNWERMNQINLGLDLFAHWRWAPDLTVDVYRRTVQDLAAVGGIEGEKPMLTNIGAGRTEGLEVDLEFNIRQYTLDQQQFEINLAGMRTEVLHTPDGLPVNLYAGNAPVAEAFRMVPGDPLSGIYGYETDGRYIAGESRTLEPGKETGDIRLIDQNDDGRITPDDRILLGNSLPKWTMGAFYFLREGPWSTQIGFSTQWGSKILRYHELDALQPGETRPTDQLVQAVGVFRLQKLSVHYEVPNKKLPNHFLELFIKGENLFLISNYRGFDPTINSALPLPGPIPSVDFGAYPTPRTILAGIRYRFR